MILKINGVPQAVEAYCGQLSDQACAAKLAYLHVTYGTGNPLLPMEKLFVEVPIHVGSAVYHFTMKAGHDYLHAFADAWSMYAH